MLIIEGKYNTAKVFTDELEDGARAQIKELCDQEFTIGSQIRIMPDVHEGAGCTIGTTMTITDKIVPNLVGVDIGCGMETIKIQDSDIDFAKLDKLIYSRIPSGYNIRKNTHKYNGEIDLSKLRCKDKANLKIRRGELSLGTLGGGNHFIEANQDDEGDFYIVVHSGSRHIGLEVAQYYQREAYKTLDKKEYPDIPKALSFVSGQLMDDYLHDMKIIQRFAMLNRKAMLDEIIDGMNFNVVDDFTTIHNYIDTDRMILRKGAVSALEGEKFLIPISMRDGSLICEGKGNQDWNYSAPHGAGRLMSRKEAKNTFTLSQLKKEMLGIYSTSLNKNTLDEAPMAYKDMEDIIRHIGDTAKVLNKIKPIYNFKAS